MCCLFGFLNYSNKPIKDLHKLTNALARQATVRGTDATGIAYCDKNKLVIHKEPKSAYDINFKHPDSVIAISGHTRHATQGKEELNFNNHPFSGSCKNLSFALSHNGVLSNDRELKRKYHLPKTKIETDSYVAVQLLKHKRKLNADSIKFMAENVKGTFAFTILDSNNVLHLIRGDSPLSLLHFYDKKIYVYASTDSILFKSLVDTELFEDVKKGKFEEIKINSGDIISIHPDGTIVFDRFDYKDTSYLNRYNWWDYGFSSWYSEDDAYVESLKSVAPGFGYSSDDIDDFLNEGFSCEDIEEFLYCGFGGEI